MDRSEWGQAEKLLSEAVKACSEDADAHRYYAEALWHQEAREKAVSEMMEAGQLADSNAEIHVRLAEMQHEMGRTVEAERSVQTALDLDPRLSEAWAMRGRMMRDGGQLEQALGDYHHALALSPTSAEIQLEIAEIHRRLNQPERALAALNSATETYAPGNEPQRLLYLRGLACAAMGRYEDALESYNAACIRHEPKSEILYRLAEVEALCGRPNRAADAVREALELDPQHQPSRKLLDHLGLARVPRATRQQR